MHISIGLVALKGRCPALADAMAVVQAFTVMSPDMSLGYIGVSDGFVGGAGSANHLVERLHVAIAKEIEGELHAEAPRFLQAGADLEGWWRTVVRAAFRVVDGELVARNGAMAVGSPAVVVLALKEYFVLANRGATGAVICRGEQAVQLTSKRTTEPYNKKEEDEQMEGGHVVRSTSNLEENMKTSQAISFRPYFPEPEVQIVELEPQDKFMILGTSGFWAHISPDEACSFIQKKLRMSQSDILLAHTINDNMRFQTILAKGLAEQAIIRGSRSNVTVGVILFKH